jgi:hypothetical protein
MEVNDEDIDQFVLSQLQTADRTYPPSWTAADVLWGRLAQKRRQRLHRTRWLLSAAASILILVTAGWPWQQTKLSNKASHPIAMGTMDAVQSEEDALAYIYKLCQGNNAGCTSPDFQTLKEDLAATNKSLNEVTQAMARFGQDEHLLRAKERIETHQARIIRAMVQML